jgi:uncharacterized RDD family membrane protein YckC
MSKDNLKGNYAGFVSRIIAFGIDIAIITITLILISLLINAVISLIGLDDGVSMRVFDKLLLSGALALIYSASYFIFFWTLASQTPGKTLMGLRIVTTGGQPLNFGRSVRRLVGYAVSIFVLWLGFVWILIDNRRQGWHDKIAGTLVVYSWNARGGGYFADSYQHKQEDSIQDDQTQQQSSI